MNQNSSHFRRRTASGLHPSDISYWFSDLYGDEEVSQRASLVGAVEADVCIVGAGYSGLWTALELLRAAPELSVVLLEARVAGFGASGRNGGACIAMIQGSRAQWARKGGREGAIALERATIDAVDEIESTITAEGIECDFAHDGAIELARTELELQRFKETVLSDREWGFGVDDYRMLSAEDTRGRINVPTAIGARFSPHCARIQPAALVRGLAEAVERRGGKIYEGSVVTSLGPGVATTAAGSIRAKYVLRMTEAYTDSIRSERRAILPIHTSTIVTEQIDEGLWKEIGWERRELLLPEHPFLSLQQTADRRLTVGGDDARVPYLYGSRPSPPGSASPEMVKFYRGQLVRLLPVLRDVRVESSWQGVFGAPRTWRPGVHLDSKTGMGWAGGYAGEGVVASNLAGRTMRDLILGTDTALTKLPWVVDRSPRRWEPEPLRYIGAHAIDAMRRVGERQEMRTGRSSRVLTLGNRIAGYQGHG